jgi:hypothetical protein
MLKEGCLEGVDEVYGYHNWSMSLRWLLPGASRA